MAETAPISTSSRPREFQRAYKACLLCRKRKSKCELGAEDYSAGRPCARCRRELKDCVFPSVGRPSPRKGRTSGTADAQLSGTNGTPRLDREVDNHRYGNNAGTGRTANLDKDSAATSKFQGGEKESEYLRENDQFNGVTLANRQASSTNDVLADSVMRTVVSSGKDALNLLFVAAHQDNEEGDDQTTPLRTDNVDHAPAYGSLLHGTPGSGYSVNTPSASSYPTRLPSAASNALDVWNACRFVKMGWFSAKEAMLYVDLFFQNISPLSPILTDFFQDHANHFLLVTQEPMLCCVVLTISSRYHNLPGPGGVSRGYLIHERLWDHCQHIILRVVLGQEKGSKAKTRTLGTIEALLLLTEWNPRALHFPPPIDGWDSDLLLTAVDERDEPQQGTDTLSRGRWLEDVINPAKRSDRMSWMLVGNCLSLAHELGVFEDNDKDDQKDWPGDERRSEQRLRLRKLLYLYIEQLSSRLGCKSIVPQGLGHTVVDATSSMTSAYGGMDHWRRFMSAWIELTKMVKSVSDMLFPSSAFTNHLLRNGRYANLIEHFQPLLLSWKDRNLISSNSRPQFYDILCMEYQWARIYTNSLGLQAVVERILAESDTDQNNRENANIAVDSVDYGFIQEVVDGSLEILQKAIELAETKVLMYSPVRIFLRITTASVFLLKGLSLGVGANKLRTSLDILTRGIAALRVSALDDVHLGSRYATLLEIHVARLKSSFIPSTRPPTFATRPPSVENGTATGIGSNSSFSQAYASSIAMDIDCDSLGGGALGQVEDWLTLPFDPSLVPFVPSDTQGFSWLGDATLDFIWNLESM